MWTDTSVPLISFPNRMQAYPVASDSLLKELTSIPGIGGPLARPRGSILFGEGQNNLGIHVVLGGRIKLSVGSDNGRAFIVGFVGRGTILGLSSAILGGPHSITATVAKPATLTYIDRDHFTKYMRSFTSLSYEVAKIVSATHYSVLAQLKTVLAPQHAEQKVARFLLGLYPNGDSAQIAFEQCHEEIGQMLDLSRETVTRIFSNLRKQRILEARGNTLVLYNRAELEALASVPEAAPAIKRSPALPFPNRDSGFSEGRHSRNGSRNRGKCSDAQGRG